MNIHGLNRLTLLDYPGHVSATLFLGGCNFRCPFCQNANLVLHPETEPGIPEEEVFAYLKKRRPVLEGVCISGGEPTLYQELPELIRRIKDLNYLVKLDTNGSNPDMIKYLFAEHLIDFVAMDIKSSKEHYELVAGRTQLNLSALQDSIDFLMSGQLDYEFRTTVVKGLHTKSDFEHIRDWISGCRAYYLQSYRASEHVICPGFESFTREELEAFQTILQKKIPLVKLRGID